LQPFCQLNFVEIFSTPVKNLGWLDWWLAATNSSLSEFLWVDSVPSGLLEAVLITFPVLNHDSSGFLGPLLDQRLNSFLSVHHCLLEFSGNAIGSLLNDPISLVKTFSFRIENHSSGLIIRQ